MRSRWKTYLLYGSLIVVGGIFIYLIAETIKLKNTGFETKTLWDWMDLLIIPLVLAIGAFFLQRSERAIERQTTNDRAKLEREITKDRQQEAALQAYIKQMSELLLKENLRTTKKNAVRDVARTLTISVIRGLDKERNDLVIQFLREAKLITDKNSILNGADMAGMNMHGLNLINVHLQKVNLTGANLEEADLSGANLERSNLSGGNLKASPLYGADLSGALLSKVDLSGAYLFRADLSDAHLFRAVLSKTDLGEANLERAHLHEAFLFRAHLSKSNLKGANLKEANLLGANLEEADLSGADLKLAKVTSEQLASVATLKGAIMPDGTKHE